MSAWSYKITECRIPKKTAWCLENQSRSSRHLSWSSEDELGNVSLQLLIKWQEIVEQFHIKLLTLVVKHFQVHPLKINLDVVRIYFGFLSIRLFSLVFCIRLSYMIMLTYTKPHNQFAYYLMIDLWRTYASI